MIRRSLSAAGPWCALWLGTLAAGVAAPAWAAEPAGPVLIDAISAAIEAPVLEGAVPAASPASASQSDTIREARRLLIDLPGGDPLSAAASELLMFGSGGENAAAANTAAGEPADEPADWGATGLQLDVILAEDEARDELTLDDLTVPRGKSALTPADLSLPAQVRTANKSSAKQPVEAEAPAPIAPANNLSPEMLKLCEKVRTVLARQYPRHQNSRDNSPWEVMHAIIAYGVDTTIYRGGPGGPKVNAIGYMCYNYPCRDQRMLLINRGKIDASRGVGVQGHGGQFLAILAQSHVKSDYPMLVEGKKFTLADLIAREQETCVAGEELTFKLIAMAHYLDPDATWTTPNGQKWSIERLVREELKAPIRGAACGGTHRLMGYSYAVKKREQRGRPITGDFKRAQTYLRDYHRYTFGLQNPDGSFSTAWFERKAADPSIDRRLKTSGHILEWISFSLSDEELRDPRMVKAVDYVATLMLTNDRHTWEIGPLGHALHALMIYEQRVFKDVVPMPASTLAGEESLHWLEARRRDMY